MRLTITLCNGGRIRVTEKVVLDSVEDLEISVRYAKKTNEDLRSGKEVLFVRSGMDESAYTVLDGCVTVPKDFLSGDNVIFGYAVYVDGVSMERWGSAPISITHAESAIILGDEYDVLRERVSALEQQMAYINKIMTGYSVL